MIRLPFRTFSAISVDSFFVEDGRPAAFLTLGLIPRFFPYQRTKTLN